MHTPEELELIEALYQEYLFLCHDDFDADVDMSPETYLENLKEMTYDELVEETQTDDTFTLEEYLRTWA